MSIEGPMILAVSRQEIYPWKTAAWRREIEDIRQESNEVGMALDKIKKEIEKFNEYCQGKFYGDEYRTRKEYCDKNEAKLYQ